MTFKFTIERRREAIIFSGIVRNLNIIIFDNSGILLIERSWSKILIKYKCGSLLKIINIFKLSESLQIYFKLSKLLTEWF